ncbi:MAG: polyprenyl synthetase family protein [Planctomycetota bacterium JB042]
MTTLPPRVPVQRARPVQSNIPARRSERDRLARETAAYVEEQGLVPPISIRELREHAVAVRERTEVDEIHLDFLSVLVNNAVWKDSLARIPFERRLLLLPKCLRVEEKCPAPFDELGLLCKECGLCTIQDLTAEADRLGYAVLVAEGSAVVRQMIETGRIEAVVGVSCLHVLEKCFPHMEAAAVPGAAIPLLQDDCANTTVDVDLVWNLIHLTSDDRTHRLDLDRLKKDVRGWFAPAALDRLLGDAGGETDGLARAALTEDGNRWRPYLATCVATALAQHEAEDEWVPPDEFRRLAVAIECFHKASLVHDDIEDGDDERYGRPTMHARHGVPVALNVGDLLLGEGYRLLADLDLPPERRVAMVRAAADAHVTLARGQGAELAWSRAPRPLPPTEVLEVFERKTAPAFRVALALAGAYVGADAETLEGLDAYGTALGIAYQVKDDLEDFDGSSDSFDARDARPSLLLAIAHKRARDDDERAAIEALLLGRAEDEAALRRGVRLAHELGAVDKARELLNAYQEQAVRALRTLSNPTLKGLLRRVVHKIFPLVLLEGTCSSREADAAARTPVSAT